MGKAQQSGVWTGVGGVLGAGGFAMISTNLAIAGVLLAGAAVSFVFAFRPSLAHVRLRLPWQRRTAKVVRPGTPERIVWGVQVVERDVYVGIKNYGDSQEFQATVERIEGTADPTPLPFVSRWREQDGERREIAERNTSLLYLVRVEPEGDIEKYPIAHGAATKASVKRLRYWKPARFRFMGLRGQEHVVYLDIRDPEAGLSSWLPKGRMYERPLRVLVRLRSADGAINEVRTVVLRIQESRKPRKPGEGYRWGADDEIVAEIMPTVTAPQLPL